MLTGRLSREAGFRSSPSLLSELSDQCVTHSVASLCLTSSLGTQTVSCVLPQNTNPAVYSKLHHFRHNLTGQTMDLQEEGISFGSYRNTRGKQNRKGTKSSPDNICLDGPLNPKAAGRYSVLERPHWHQPAAAHLSRLFPLLLYLVAVKVKCHFCSRQDLHMMLRGDDLGTGSVLISLQMFQKVTMSEIRRACSDLCYIFEFPKSALERLILLMLLSHNIYQSSSQNQIIFGSSEQSGNPIAMTEQPKYP